MVDINPSAPVFTAKIDVPPTISLSKEGDNRDKATLSVALQGDKPVMVSASKFCMADLEYVLGRPRSSPPEQEELEWMPFRDEDACMAGAVTDDPDYEVVVGESDKFRCLQPGETWILATEHIPDMDDYPDLESGDQLVISFRGTNIEWWDWGTPEDHKNTKVTFCGQFAAGGVTHPKDNDGRPSLEIPAVDKVTCRVIE